MQIIAKVIIELKEYRFSDALSGADMFGFRLDRIDGSHYIFALLNVSELINLQNMNGKAKPYQVKQLL